MATQLLGTNANNTLTALRWAPNSLVADIYTIADHILNDNSQPQGQLANAAPSAKPVWPGALTKNGVLYVPNRGILRLLPNDVVAFDANGWPILVSANAIAGGGAPSAATSWTLT